LRGPSATAKHFMWSAYQLSIQLDFLSLKIWSENPNLDWGQNKLTQYGTDGRLLTTHVSAKFKVT